MTFSNVLVATDFSVGANRALDAAASLAARLGAAVHLLHVVEDPVLSMPWSEDRVFDLAMLKEELVSDAERRLTTMAAAYPDLHMTRQALVGHPAETIVRAAADRGADLVVVGTHGRGGVARMFMGSVAERVVRLAGCPVLTVRDTRDVGRMVESTAAAQV